MITFRRVVSGLLLLAVVCAASTAGVQASQPSEPEQLSEFVPIEDLPPQEELPAAPLLIAAYAFVWVALFAYVVSLSRRLGSVAADVQRLEREVKKR
ncbi:MAG: CcmD family protein [Acidimicrobiia bacterium]|nr:CcmD family protein [Acidimicrobiia bacterium]